MSLSGLKAFNSESAGHRNRYTGGYSSLLYCNTAATGTSSEELPTQLSLIITIINNHQSTPYIRNMAHHISTVDHCIKRIQL